MRHVLILAGALGGTALLGACNESGMTASAGSPQAAQEDPSIPTKAQPKLATIKLWIGAEEMVAEMAITPLQERTGMMFRTNMAENEGMIFVLNGPQRASFWMKNTILPLSAAYIDTEGKILEIHDFKPHDTNSVVASSDQVQFVLETRQGWFKRHNIGTNVVVSTEKGSLKKTFLGRQ
jgi:uncharacterized membrane protein (UPF0127 family)